MEGKSLTEIMPEMAEEAQRNPDGWMDEFEERDYEDDEGWVTASGLLNGPYWRYRRRQKFVVRTLQHPFGLLLAPEHWQIVYRPSLKAVKFYASFNYTHGDPAHRRLLERGFIHATPEAAAVHGRALAGVSDE